MRILNNFSKVLEKGIYSSVIINISEYIFSHQHGQSTLTNLYSITQYISQHLDRHGHVDVIYTDLSAAFDSIDYGLF